MPAAMPTNRRHDGSQIARLRGRTAASGAAPSAVAAGVVAGGASAHSDLGASLEPGTCECSDMMGSLEEGGRARRLAGVSPQAPQPAQQQDQTRHKMGVRAPLTVTASIN